MLNYSSLIQLSKEILPEKTAFAIRRYRWLKRFRDFRPRTIKRRFGTTDLTVELVDPVGEGWYGHDWLLPPEIPLLEQSRLRPGATVFDLGAHQCVMAMLLSKIVGPTGLVVAIEGASRNVCAGRRNVELNSISNCKIIHGVAAGTSGLTEFDAVGNGNVINERNGHKVMLPEVVQCYSVDDLAVAHGKPDVVYVDVEGCECQVLEGARNTMGSKPDWMIEVHQGEGLEEQGGSVSRVLSYFATGYQCFIARQHSANDYAHWNEFECLERSELPNDRFYLVAIAKRD